MSAGQRKECHKRKVGWSDGEAALSDASQRLHCQMSSFEKVVKNACKPKPAPPKSKVCTPPCSYLPHPSASSQQYIDPIIAATWSEDGAIHDVCRALAPRFREPNSIVSSLLLSSAVEPTCGLTPRQVVFKALVILHTMTRNGAMDNVLQYLSSSEVLRLKNVVGGQWECMYWVLALIPLFPHASLILYFRL